LLLWRFSAFDPHFFDVSKGSEFLTGNLFNDESAAIPLFSQSAYAHAAGRKRALGGVCQAQRGIKSDIGLSGLSVAGHQPFALSRCTLSIRRAGFSTTGGSRRAT
jgi:hypothetical protein